MNGDAEQTPTDPGVAPDRAALEEIARGLTETLRAIRRASVSMQNAGPDRWQADLAAAADASRRLNDVMVVQTEILDRLKRSEAATLELAAVRDERPRNWTEWGLGLIAAVSATAATSIYALGHADAALLVASLGMVSAYLARSPLPPKKPKDKTGARK